MLSRTWYFGLTIGFLVLLASLGDVDGKGSPSGSSYGGRSGGVYGASSSSRYYMYPAAGAFLYMGYGRSYRRNNYNQRTSAMNAAAEDPYSYYKLNITTAYGAGALAEVYFFAPNEQEPIGTGSTGVTGVECPGLKDSTGFNYDCSFLIDGKLTSGFDDANSGKEIEIIFTLNSALKVAQYQLGVASSGRLSAKWQLSGSSTKRKLIDERKLQAPASIWKLIDSTFGVYENAEPNTFITAVISGACPYGYQTPTIPQASATTTATTPSVTSSSSAEASGRQVVKNTEQVVSFESSTDTFKCAASCDEKGLACTAYTAKLSTGSTGGVVCTLYGTDYTLNANGNLIVTINIPQDVTLCNKAGLVDCNSAVCKAVVPNPDRRRLQDTPLDFMSAMTSTTGSDVFLATENARSHLGRRGDFAGKQSSVGVGAGAGAGAGVFSDEVDESQAGFFHCDNGRSIERQFACDRVDDCGDGSDEARPFPCAEKAPTPLLAFLPALWQRVRVAGIGAGPGADSSSTGPKPLGRRVPLELHSHNHPVIRNLPWRATEGHGHKGSSFTLDLGKARHLNMIGLQNAHNAATRVFHLQLGTPPAHAVGATVDKPCDHPEVRFTTAATGPLPLPMQHGQVQQQTTELLLHGHKARCVRFVAKEGFETKTKRDSDSIHSIPAGLGEITVFESKVDQAAEAKLRSGTDTGTGGVVAAMRELFDALHEHVQQQVHQVTGKAHRDAGEKAQVERHQWYLDHKPTEAERRRLASTATTAKCKTCPSFNYPDDGASIGGTIGGVVVFFIAVGLCCFCFRTAQQKEQKANQQQMQTYNQSPPIGQQQQPVMPSQQAATLGSMTMMVTCPPGVAAGQMVNVSTPQGALVTVTIPPGISEGMQFGVNVPAPVAPMEVAMAMPMNQAKTV